MRSLVLILLAAFGISAAVVAGPRDVLLAGVNQSRMFAIESVLPAQVDVVGVAHPVVMTLSAPVANRQFAERALEVKSVPAMTGKFEWLEDNVVQWVPDRFWPSYSTVSLSMGGLSTSFKTGPEVVGVADISEHTFTVTVDGVGAETPGPRLPAPHHLPRLGEEGVMLASMGKDLFPTPLGTYSVISKERDITMDSSSVGIPLTDPEGYMLEVEHAVRITHRGIFVHSAPWAVPSLGVENVSHGCISLNPDAAEWYFDMVNVGDPVIVQE